MQQLTTGPLSLLLCLSVLTGWFIHDFQAYNLIKVSTEPISASMQKADQTEVRALKESTTPNINTNWFSGSSLRVSSEKPLAQSNDGKSEGDIAQGRILGESYGNDKP